MSSRPRGSGWSREYRWTGATISSAPWTARATAADPLFAAFVAGRRLSAARTAQLLAAAKLPGRPGGCSKPHDGVLVLSHGGVTPAQIEVGGCSRVVREDQGRSTVGRVNAAVVAGLVP